MDKKKLRGKRSRFAGTSGYAHDQDSTMFSLSQNEYYQDIVVTIIFHFNCSRDGGAYLEISEKILKK